ncbi:MAG: metallophosphoesterase family protein [Calditrichia bacterium]
MFAVISDIHGNLEALQSVLTFLSERNIDNVICLGDTVGYGPNPNESIELLRKHHIICCLGNHDAASIGETSIYQFNSIAAEAVLWTKSELTRESIAFLKTLPLTVSHQKYLFVHASPDNPKDWQYLHSEYEITESFKFFSQSICFVGHTHRPYIFSEKRKQITEKSVELQADDRYVINVGSVGQPRDGDPRSCLVIIDEEKSIASIERIGYDVDRVGFKIRHAGLPAYLAERLSRGM